MVESSLNDGEPPDTDTQVFTNADALEKWLRNQPANTPETLYKTTVNMDSATDLKKALDTAGRYVWLDLTASTLSAIEEGAFYNCKKLTALTLPETLTRIDDYAFDGCTSLTSVMFNCLITAANFSRKDAFPGNLRTAYLAGLAGTYTRANNTVLTWDRE